MFQSCEFLGKDEEDTHIFIYKLIDDEFECECKSATMELGLMVILEYQKRKLNAGKNLVLFIHWCLETGYILSINGEIEWQDRYYKKFIKNWSKIKKERNKYLKKMMIWS